MPAAAVIVAALHWGFCMQRFCRSSDSDGVKMAGGKIGGGIMESVQSSASFGFRPSESFLTGRKKKEKKD